MTGRQCGYKGASDCCENGMIFHPTNCHSLAPIRFILRCGILVALLLPSGAAMSRQPTSRGAPRKEFMLHAEGQQIYVCHRSATGALEWKLDEPAAELFEGYVYYGIHSAGPSWLLSDGSSVRATVMEVTHSARHTDVPQLHLKVTQHGGRGLLSGARYVDRVQTMGGALSGTCTLEDLSFGVPYEANYRFTFD